MEDIHQSCRLRLYAARRNSGRVVLLFAVTQEIMILLTNHGQLQCFLCHLIGSGWYIWRPSRRVPKSGTERASNFGTFGLVSIKQILTKCMWHPHKLKWTEWLGGNRAVV